MSHVYIVSGPGEIRCALADETDEVREFHLIRRDFPSKHDAIYCGRVIDHITSLGMVVIDLGRKERGFLHYKQPRHMPPIGEKILVQSLDFGEDDKVKRHSLIKLTTNISLTNRYFSYMPHRREITLSPKAGRKATADLEALHPKIAFAQENLGGGVLRVAGITARVERFQHAILTLHKQWQEILGAYTAANAPKELAQPDELLRWLESIHDLESISADQLDILQHVEQALGPGDPGIELSRWVNRGTFPEPIEEMWESLTEALLPLPSGGQVILEETAAATVIDVNSGNHTVSGDAEHLHLKVNLEAAEIIAKHLRLRNYHGLILVDFITMKRPDFKQRLEQKLKSLAKQDTRELHVHGLTKRGVAELVREGRSPSLVSRLCQRQAPQKTPVTVALHILRHTLKYHRHPQLTIQAAPAVVQELEGRLKHSFDELENRLGFKVTLEVDPSLSLELYHILI